MSVLSAEGKLGTGKTKFAVWRAQTYLRQGRRVASNVDLVLSKLVPEKRCSYLRLPDKPSAFDLEALGHGNSESYDEDRNGLLVLDELGTWLNTRSFQDKGRAAVIDWLIHARKLGWDVILIVQDSNMIDRQVREALIEYQCKCMRLDKVRVPVIGRLLGVFGGRWGYMPRMHLVTSRVGSGANAVIAERWMYRGDDLHAAYDTRQVFSERYPHGAHTVLPAWDFVVPLTPLEAARARLRALFPGPAPRPPLKPRLPEVAAVMHLPEFTRLAVLRGTFCGPLPLADCLAAPL